MNHSINICFSTTDGLISRLIRWFTKSNVSHCYLTFRDQTLDRVMVMETNLAGFVLVPWKEELLKGRRLIARYTVCVDEKKQIEAIRRLACYLGTGYDFVRLLRLAIGGFWQKFKNPSHAPTKILCSESVVRFINSLGVVSLTCPEAWTPAEVYLFVKENPKLFKLEEKQAAYYE